MYSAWLQIDNPDHWTTTTKNWQGRRMDEEIYKMNGTKVLEVVLGLTTELRVEMQIKASTVWETKELHISGKLFKIHCEWVWMVTGIIAKFLGKLWDESQSWTTVRVCVWMCELRKRTMLSLQPYSSWILRLVWDGHVGGWNALQAALVCTITREMQTGKSFYA